MTSWEKFKRLSWAEFWILFASFFLLPLTNFLLKLMGYIRLHQFIEWSAPIRKKQSLTKETMLQAKSIARMVAIAASHGLYRATCLRKSLLVLWFLRRQNINGVICFGVRLVNGILEAHAWVEWQDTVINDEADVREHFVILEKGLPDTQVGL